MTPRGHLRNLAVALTGCGFALLALAVWIPLDVDTGVIDVWRRNVRIGDAMLPVFSAAGMALAGAVIGVRSLLRDAEPAAGRIDPRFLAWLAATLAAGLALMLLTLPFGMMACMALMLLTGPILAWIVTGGETPYRVLRATAPWKYLGFALGGTVMTFGLIALSQHRPSWRLAALAFVATLVIALLYDLPFDNLLLPPNGDF